MIIFITSRNKPKELIYYETLAKYTTLTQDERKQMHRLQRGFLGEQLYDSVLEEIGHQHLIVFRDIWIKVGKSSRQIDTLIITDNEIIVNEVKHYTGNYMIKEGQWSVNQINISENPIMQAQRSSNKVIELCNNYGIRTVVTFKVIFTDEYFILDSDLHETKNIVLRSYMKKYFRALGNKVSSYHSNQIKEYILEHIIDNPLEMPVTDFSRIHFGFRCEQCGSKEIGTNNISIFCRECDYREKFRFPIFRMIRDYAILTNQEKFTSENIRRMCDYKIAPRTIRRYLAKYCIPEPNKRGYYRLKNEYLQQENERILLKNLDVITR